jgi:hypothetical protein
MKITPAMVYKSTEELKRVSVNAITLGVSSALCQADEVIKVAKNLIRYLTNTTFDRTNTRKIAYTIIKSLLPSLDITNLNDHWAFAPIFTSDVYESNLDGNRDFIHLLFYHGLTDQYVYEIVS